MIGLPNGALAVVCTLASVCTLTLSTVASAQPQNAGRIEVSGGIRWMGPIDFAEVPANETTNGGGTSALFRSQMALEGSVGGTATLGVRLSRRFLPKWQRRITRLTSPRASRRYLEAPNATVDSPLTQFLVEGGIVAQVPMRRATSVRPFLTAGIGYLRQLNDGRTLVDTGSDYYVGGGLYYVRLATCPRKLKATGLRADVRATISAAASHRTIPDMSRPLSP